MTAEMLARIAEYAQRVAEQAPPLTDAQRHLIATMFRRPGRKVAA